MSEEAEAEVQADLVGIRGWLILPAIGLSAGPIIGIVALGYATTLFSDVAAAGQGGLYAFELAMEFALLGLMIFAAVRFFGKRSNAPKFIVGLLIVAIGIVALQLAVELSVGARDFAIESIKQLVRNIIGAAIWIPYFVVSKRVKATFIR